MVSRNEGHVTDGGGQSCLEGVATGGTVVTRQKFGHSVTSLHLDEEGKREACWSRDCIVRLFCQTAFSYLFGGNHRWRCRMSTG